MSRLYETLVIIDSMIPDEAIDSEFDAIEQKINASGKVLKIDKIGKKRLAYKINSRSHGEYAVFYYEGEPAVPAALEKGFRINENVLRWLSVVDAPWGVPSDEVKEESVESEKTVEKTAEKVAEKSTEEVKEG